MTSQALHALIEDSFSTLVAQLEAGRSETLTAYLTAAARFPRYSWSNQFLIAAQRPDATRVAGFQAWRRLGRSVRRSEHGIVIVAPIVRRARRLDDDPLAAENATAPLGFRAAYVFDGLSRDSDHENWSHSR